MSHRPDRRVVASLMLLLVAATAFAQDQPEKVQVFETLGPIEDADPGRRHQEVLWMPTALFIEPRDIGTLVQFDSTSVREVKISVGHRMVVGCEWVLYYYDGTEPIELRRNLGGSLGTLFGSGAVVIQGLTEIPKSEGSLQLVAELTLIETDIPMQHAWNPKQGRYRTLWRGLATGVLTSETVRNGPP